VLSRDDVRPVLVADVAARGARWPVFAHVVEHPDGLLLVDTGLVEAHPVADRWEPRIHPLPDELAARVAVVVNTHLHFDHCGGNGRFPGVPLHVQRRELEDARQRPDADTIPEWLDVPGAEWVVHDGEAEVLPGVRLVPAPGHTDGHQVVVVEAVEGPVVLGGDVAYSFRELGRGDTEGRRRVLELRALTYLAHVDRPRVPEFRPDA